MKKLISTSLIAIAGFTMSSIALSAGGIPQSFPAHSTAIGKMPSQAISRQPSFPPARAMPTIPTRPAMPTIPTRPAMPSQSIQGTSRIPAGPGLNGFNNRGPR